MMTVHEVSKISRVSIRTLHYYDEILHSLGMMYAGGGDFTTNIDKFGGEGTAAYACKAIEAMIERKKLA